jgi:DNA modification methylase
MLGITTGIAALKLSHRFIGVEKSAHYFDVACRRVEAWLASGRP